MTLNTVTRLSQWYDQRPLRERVVLLVCLVIVLIFLVNLLLLQPFSKQRTTARGELKELKSSLILLNAQETAIMKRKGSDPDQENRLQLEILQQKTAENRQHLNNNIVALVSPDEMPALLKELLTRQKRLQIIRLENLSPELIQLNQQQPQAEEKGDGDQGEALLPTLYRHRLQLEFSGDYLTLLKYLRQLEQLPRSMVWENVEIETIEYPEATVRLQIYTLSLTEGWIGG